MDWAVPGGDETRTWQLRAMEPKAALEQDWARAYVAAATACFEATGAFTCVVDGVEFVDGWAYWRLPDVPDEEVQRRRVAHAARGDAAIDAGTCLWESEIRPEVESILTGLRRRRPRTEAIPGLVRHVEQCMAGAAHVMGHLHWTFAFSWTSDWGQEYPKLTGDEAVGAAVVPPEIEPGDIVVARDAGPAWTPIFPLLGGLVLDHGWVTQHAAIVCREYGIPCVLATTTATTDIPDGVMIRLDGTTGVVDFAD